MAIQKRAPKRKTRLLRWVNEWNESHPKKTDQIDVPSGFKKETPHVGVPAKHLIRSMQRAKGLPITGKFDKRTLRVLFPPTFRVKVFRVAHGELGVQEVPLGSNTGPRVRVYQSVTKAYKQPWCASFASWCCRQVEGDFPLPAYAADVTAWTNAAKSGTHPRLKKIGKLAARKGDIVTFDWDKDGEPDHIGFFQGWIVPLVSFKAVEGNTGDGVRVESRWFAQVKTFIRVTEK
jgi:hypothetical protein